MKIEEYIKKPEYEEFGPIFLDKMKKIKKHNFLDYEAVMSEIEKMNIPIDIEMISDDDIELNSQIIDIIQAYKDRMTDLYCKAERDYEIIEGNYQTLIKIWIGCYSTLGSDKKREGEAEMLFCFLDPERRKRREVTQTLKAHLKNMSDKFFSVSRKAAIHEHVYKLVGTGYIEQPDAFSKALKKRRPDINEKMDKLKKKIASGATGWETVPSEDEI